MHRAERQSARMSKITNDGLTLSGTGCFIAVYPYMATVGLKGLHMRSVEKCYLRRLSVASEAYVRCWKSVPGALCRLRRTFLTCSNNIL